MGSSNVRADKQALQRTMEAIISESQRAGTAVQPQLPGLERTKPARTQSIAQRNLPDMVAQLVFDIPARRRLDDLVLAPELKTDVQEFVSEYGQAPLLRANSLEPRHTVLLIGPPGNGKTSLAEVFATELALPLLMIRYDALVDSYLGETANRLRRLIDYATLNPCVLFFDEFDAVGKERNDTQETGEIKRVVSTLLMQMDRLPSHAIVVCATNHPEMLDRAVWRRFELKLDVQPPGAEELAAWFDRFEQSLGTSAGISAAQFAAELVGENMSEVEAFTLDVRRRMVLSRGKLTASEAMRQALFKRKRALKYSITDRENGSTISNRAPQKRAPAKGKNPG